MGEPKQCSIEGCTTRSRSLGLCHNHYQQHLREKRAAEKAALPVLPKEPKRCSEDGCTNIHYSRGYCQNHYRMVRRRERGLKPPGPRPGPKALTWDVKNPRSTNEHCANGHPWNEHTEAFTTGDKRYCRYCTYLATAQTNGYEAKSLEDWITYRETRAAQCKRGHLWSEHGRETDNGWRCKKCDVDNRRRARYGIEPEEYDALNDKQDGKCAGCLIDLSTLDVNHIHLDHDHGTDAVRGLLCHSCNLLLGHSKDDPSTLRRLADYLEQ